jgi:hypothetical protein
VQAFPSSQEVPFESAGYVQVPVPVSHVAPVAVRHAGGALQTTGFVPVHTPT